MKRHDLEGVTAEHEGGHQNGKHKAVRRWDADSQGLNCGCIQSGRPHEQDDVHTRLEERLHGHHVNSYFARGRGEQFHQGIDEGVPRAHHRAE